MSTGRYDFQGLKKISIAAIEAALAATTWGASLLASPWIKFFSPIEDWALGLVINWLANKGLIVLNLGAIYVNGEFDQAAFDKAIDDGLKKVRAGGLSEAQGKQIDDAVRAAADKFIDFGAADNSVPNVPDPGFQSGSDPSVQ